MRQKIFWTNEVSEHTSVQIFKSIGVIVFVMLKNIAMNQNIHSEIQTISTSLFQNTHFHSYEWA